MVGGGLTAFNIILIAAVGWRNTVSLMGVLGIFFGLFSLIVMKEPERAKEPETSKEPEAKIPIMQKFKNSFSDLFANPVTKWCALSGAFRTMIVFACDYFLPLFFILAYPANKVQFSLLYGTMQIGFGFTSSLMGGMLAKRLGPKYYSKICQASALAPLPFLWLTLLQTNSFTLSIFGAGMKYLLGEWFWAPNVAMMQQSVPPKKFGSCISAYQFIVTIAGCLSAFMTGSIINFFNGSFDKVIIGKILACVTTFAYLGSIFTW